MRTVLISGGLRRIVTQGGLIRGRAEEQLFPRVWRLDRRQRCRRSAIRVVRAHASSVRARLGETIVVMLVLALLAPAPGSAAGPDPAPQKASTSSSSASSPTPAPQPSPTQSPAPKPAPATGSSQSTSGSTTGASDGQGGSPTVAPAQPVTSASSGVRSTGIASSGVRAPILSAPASVAAGPSHTDHKRAPATIRRAHPRLATLHRQATSPIALPAILAQGLNLLPPLFTAPFNKLSHGDPVLMLLGALALAVLVLASLSMLKLLALAGAEGREEPGA